MDVCFVCRKVVDNDQYNVGPKGRTSLIEANTLRCDMQNAHVLERDNIAIHVKCFKNYTTK